MLLLLALAVFGVYGRTPVVLLHGMLSTNGSMAAVARWVNESFPGTYVLNIDTGSSLGSVLTDLNSMCALVAKIIRGDARLRNGFHGIGHSQGGLLMRCYVERYTHLPGYPRVRNLISWMGVQNGVFGIPDVQHFCPERLPPCLALIALFDSLLEDPKLSFKIQRSITFAAFWKDPLHYADYVQDNIFLADVNNERPVKNAQYKANLLRVENFLCIYGTLDQTVVPQTSPIFSFFAPGSVTEVIPFLESGQYKEDWLGLAQLWHEQRLHFANVTCSHHGAPTDACKPYIWPVTMPFLSA